MIFSLLHLVLTLRALLRSASQRFLFGIVGGLVRAALMLGGAALSVEHPVIIVLPGLNLRNTGSVADMPSLAVSLALDLVSIAGPILTLALLWASWKRYQNVPAAREEILQRPFSAWLPVALLDALYVVLTIAAVVIAESA